MRSLLKSVGGFRFGLASSRCRGVVLAGITGLAAMPIVAHARAVSRPAGVRVTQNGWTFVPIVVQDMGTLDIPGVLAIRDTSQAVGENIVAVWYENPGASGAEWPAVGWESPDPWEAIKWAKQVFGIGDEYDVLWPTTASPTAGEPTEIPQNYFKGLLTNDAFATVVGEPDGEEIVAGLTAMGYKSASIDIDNDGPCDTKTILPALADTTAFAVLAQPPLSQVEARYASLVPESCAQVIPPPPPPPTPVTPGTTRPQPGTPLNPGAPWQSGPRPDRYVAGCSTATTWCYGRQIIWLYTTTNLFGLTVIRYCESEITWTCPAPAGVPPAPCPAAPTCTPPPGPYMPPPPPGNVPCEIDYY